MGVYIKGMEMPQNCFECPWRCKVDPENLLCRISGEYFEETFAGTIQTRHKSCPLIPVPEHGDLIDKNAVLAELEWANTDDDTDVRVVRYDIIKKQPTIIPADKEGET